jgi:sugar phosphate isomerase/epimerase
MSFGKHRSPQLHQSFRIGATSFVYRDGWLGNVERLASRVDDVELLFFDVDNLPPGAEIAGLGRAKHEHRLTYSVHGPLGTYLASGDRALRLAAVEAVWRTFECAAPLEPEAFIVHVEGDSERPATPGHRDATSQAAEASLGELLRRGMPADRLCIETLGADSGQLETLASVMALPIALDLGHFARDAVDVHDAVRRWLPRAPVVHWHGVANRDHQSLRHFPIAEARWFVQALMERGYAGLLTLEVFNQADFDESLQLLRSLVEEVLRVVTQYPELRV